MGDEALKRVFDYHARTKHRPERYAQGPGRLDWANQPNPFRQYLGEWRFSLPREEKLATEEGPSFDALAVPTLECEKGPSLISLSRLFFDSLAISAWKRSGTSRWALRCNPSSGNLHPTEAYALLPGLAGLHDKPGIYHYSALDHALELRCELDERTWGGLLEGFSENAFFVGLSSIHWREAWKYGERAYRYCQHDVGHALAQLSYVAASMGWRAHLLEGVDDQTIATLLKLKIGSALSEESPDALLLVSGRDEDACAARWRPREEVRETIARAREQGVAVPLGGHVVPWNAIDEVSQACFRAGTGQPRTGGSSGGVEPPAVSEEVFPERAHGARALFRSRRSAVSMDGQTSLARLDFERILSRLMPVRRVPWWTLPGPALIHPIFYVHRVDGLSPGLYILCREARAQSRLRDSLDPDFSWEPVGAFAPEGCFFRLAEGDVREFARLANCVQDIASDGAFSVSMLAEFEEALVRMGAWAYRRLHWEAGALGQVLYLEAEAVGLRGTGMGCFFDDVIHEALGMKSQEYQTLYGFTVGGAVHDSRIESLPAY